MAATAGGDTDDRRTIEGETDDRLEADGETDDLREEEDRCEDVVLWLEDGSEAVVEGLGPRTGDLLRPET
jgi:hypothetical protein